SSNAPLVEALVRAAENGEANGAIRPAHQLKGAAAYLGAHALVEAAAAAERSARANDLAALRREVERLQQGYAGLARHIQAYLQERGSG
ncbi:MAG: Hpt domain-containing protein, partial [Thiobacillaceae bacterium]|nr:Hpt domain-containing protein [Thiobacillaceae bacterium]